MTIVRRRLALVVGAVVLAGGAGSGIAIAGSHAQAPTTTPAASASAVARADTPDPGENTTGPDRDNIQQGDQSLPDHGKPGQAQEQERSGEAQESGVSDSPGGHTDPSSTVDHQFTGEE